MDTAPLTVWLPATVGIAEAGGGYVFWPSPD
jgi:hypothetical protein